MNTEEFKNKRFVDLAVGEQRMVLMMRALVGRPPLVLLDEVWSGMDESMVGAARLYLREGGGVTEEQAVVVVTHWEDEVPWGVEDGVRRFKLDGGMGSVVDV
jgi:ABC-type molybdenum transport system ATPase subunit/photorepair protein PhrA